MMLTDFGTRRGKGRGFKTIEDALWRKKAHRVTWELRFGEIPKGMELDHEPSCDKRCVNTEHMTLLTRSEHQRLTMRRPEERPKHMHPYQETCDFCERKPVNRGLCGLHAQRRGTDIPMDAPLMSRGESARAGAAKRWGKDY